MPPRAAEPSADTASLVLQWHQKAVSEGLLMPGPHADANRPYRSSQAASGGTNAAAAALPAMQSQPRPPHGGAPLGPPSILPLPLPSLRLRPVGGGSGQQQQQQGAASPNDYGGSQANSSHSSLS